MNLWPSPSSLLGTMWTTVRGWFVRAAPLPPAPAPTPAPAPQLLLEAPTNLEAEPFDDGIYNEALEELTFIHVSELLDHIPNCRASIRRLKRFDRDAYNFHKRYGARLLPYRDDPEDQGRIQYNALRPSVMANLPGKGLNYLWADMHEPDFVRFYAYFDKLLKKPWDVEGGPAETVTYYEMTLVWDGLEKEKCGAEAAGVSYYCAVQPDGTVRALRHKGVNWQYLPKGGAVQHRVWDLPSGLRSLHEDRVERQQARAKRGTQDPSERYAHPKDAFEHASQLFVMILNSWDATNDGFQITASQPGHAAVTFSVPEYRAKVFFKDREISAASDGRRKRIFHMVTEHERTLASGRVITVASHYRGARQFEWKGEAIRIDPPEESPRFMDIGGILDEFPQAPDNAMGAEEFGERLEAAHKKRARQRGGYRSAETRPATRGRTGTELRP
jgi:hypothetical protein